MKPGSNDKATRRSSGTRKASSAAGAAAAGSGVYEVYFNIGSVEAFERKLEEAQYELRVPEGMLFFFVCVVGLLVGGELADQLFLLSRHPAQTTLCRSSL